MKLYFIPKKELKKVYREAVDRAIELSLNRNIQFTERQCSARITLIDKWRSVMERYYKNELLEFLKLKK